MHGTLTVGQAGPAGNLSRVPSLVPVGIRERHARYAMRTVRRARSGVSVLVLMRGTSAVCNFRGRRCHGFRIAAVIDIIAIIIIGRAYRELRYRW